MLYSSMDTLPVYVIKRKKLSLGNQRPICYKWEQYMLVQSPYLADQKICLYSDECFYLQVRIQHTQVDCKEISTPSHLITYLTYRLKPHHTRNQYLRARLDTCMDVNIILTSVYKLIFNDPESKKLDPSTLEIGTYTTDTVKIVGSCVFYVVHMDTKKLHEVTYFVTTQEGSVLLPYTITLTLGLIQPRTRLNYLPPRRSQKNC